jgi:hypothetical protein
MSMEKKIGPKFLHYFGKKKNSSQKTQPKQNYKKLADLNSIKVHP